MKIHFCLYSGERQSFKPKNCIIKKDTVIFEVFDMKDRVNVIFYAINSRIYVFTYFYYFLFGVNFMLANNLNKIFPQIIHV